MSAEQTEILRQHARAIVESAIAAVDPELAVRRLCRRSDENLILARNVLPLNKLRSVHLLAAGKAAPRMAKALEELLGNRISSGLVATKRDHSLPLAFCETIECGHPLPDENSVTAARRALQVAEAAQENDLILCLLSGGGSAIWSAPAEGLTLEDKIKVTRLLLASGVEIHEVNTVRKHLSAIKGGHLAAAAFPAIVVTLAISDVIGNNPASIGSGPTTADPTTFAQAVTILEKFRLWHKLPPSVASYLAGGARGEIEETIKPSDPRLKNAHFEIVADNQTALSAAKQRAEELGYHVETLSSELSGEAREVGKQLADRARGFRRDSERKGRRYALLAGGETTVTVRGKGKGGRNQELALSAAIVLDGVAGVVLTSVGTDGTDGPTEAAGAIVDGETIQRARAAGIDVGQYLEDNNSYPLLEATGDLVITGPTGTNVMDIQVVLVGSEEWQGQTPNPIPQASLFL